MNLTKRINQIGLTIIAEIIASLLIVSLVSANQSNSKINGTEIKLSGTANTFDLGGIQTKDNRYIKQNRLIRSDALSALSSHDKWRLTRQHHLIVDLDFRSAGEAHQQPDKKIPHVTYHRLSVMPDPNFGVHTQRQYANQLALKHPNNMTLFYQKMVTNEHSIKAYQAMFKRLLQQNHGAVLYHCTYGKDRTGIATMLILSSLGVRKTTIMKNYLQSNQALKKTTHKEIIAMKKVTHNRNVLANLKRSRTARRSYLTAAYTAIDQKYGSIKHYLKIKMRLTKTDIQKLRRLYLTTET